ncbi:MAG: pre-peptidase C-terminal domain-containing protein [Cyanobacteria bacterium J06639_1]
MAANVKRWFGTRQAARAIARRGRHGLMVAVAGACLSLAPLGLARTAVAQNVLRAPHSESGTIGRLAIGQSASGALRGAGNDPSSSYHTYTVTVPPNTPSLIVEMAADANLDLGVKYGSAIEEYGMNADWDLGDDSQSSRARLVVPNPTPGTWYVDVINGMYTTDTVAYSLEVKAQ